MASLLALLSSAMWGTADFFAGRLSKKHHPFAVLGFSQVIGLLVGILIVLVSGDCRAATPRLFECAPKVIPMLIRMQAMATVMAGNPVS